MDLNQSAFSFPTALCVAFVVENRRSGHRHQRSYERMKGRRTRHTGPHCFASGSCPPQNLFTLEHFPDACEQRYPAVGGVRSPASVINPSVVGRSPPDFAGPATSPEAPRRDDGTQVHSCCLGTHLSAAPPPMTWHNVYASLG